MERKTGAKTEHRIVGLHTKLTLSDPIYTPTGHRMKPTQTSDV